MKAGNRLGLNSFSTDQPAPLKVVYTQSVHQHRYVKLFPIFAPNGQRRPRLGYMDVTGKTIIEPRFSCGLEFLEGRAPVLVGGKWRYIDDSGERAFAGDFGNAETFSEGRAYVIAAPRKYGFIDGSGNIVIEAKYRWASHFSEGRALVYVGGFAGFVDHDGAEVVPLKYQAANSFSEGLAAVQKDGRWGYIDREGEVVIPLRFEQPWVAPFKNGLAPFKSADLENFGFINPAARMVIEPQFRFTFGFTDGLAAVQVGERWGYIDTNGEFVIQPRFDRAYPFSEGVAAVEIECESGEPQMGFIDKSGKFLITPRFRLGCHFHDGICWTETKQTCGYINRSGEYVWQCPWVQTNMVLRL